MEYLTAFVITFTSVFLKGMQHKNVQHDMFSSVFITSFFMAALDFVIIKFIAGTTTWSMAFFCGSGAAFGMVASMVVHRWLRKLRIKKDEQNASKV